MKNSPRTGSHLAHTENTSHTSYTPRRAAKSQKPKKKHKTAVIILSVIVGLILLALLAAFILFEVIYGSMNIQKKDSVSMDFSQIDINALLNGEEEEPVDGAVTLTEEEAQALDEQTRNNVENNEIFSDSDVYNILLLGNDSRSNNINERTDVMILVSINKKTEGIVMTSFMRDIYIYIPGYFSHRLNTANALAGPSLTVDTIEQNFGVNIDNYAEVNFYAFVEIIDILGGVDIYLSSSEASVVGCGYTSGTYHLNGEQALAYCRIRKLDSDFNRTARQRTVLEAIFRDLKGISLSDATSLMNAILPQVTTDLSQGDCLNLLSMAAQLFNYDLYSARVPADGTYTMTMINGMSVLSLDFSANRSLLKESIYEAYDD